MSQRDSRALLETFSRAAGPPGAEDEVRAAVREALDGVGTLDYDRLGSLLCTKRGTADEPRVVLDSHLDEVAFMVQSIAEDGTVVLVPLGGWWGHVLLGQRVEILAEGGRIPGVIGSKPPHFLAPAERDKVLKPEAMYIDVGASTREQAVTLGIRVGDAIVPDADFRDMAVDGVVSGKAFDNRSGVALMCEAMTALGQRQHPNTVIGVGAVQEELGGRGAGTAAKLARPDVALVLECSPADDLPGQKDRQAALGHGPQIRHFDPTAISNRRLVRFVEQVARDAGIDVQMAVRRSGGTDAGQIHRSHDGVPTVVIAVPARYIHSHVSLLRMEDYRAALDLVIELVMKLDASRVQEFTDFG
jgi:endoglucanase